MGWQCLDVQAIQGSATPQQLPAFAVTVQANDLILVGVSDWNSSPAREINTPTDTAGGNTYVARPSTNLQPTTSLGLKGFSCVVTNGGASFRVTVSTVPTVAALTGIAWLWRHTSSGAPIYNGDLKTNTATATANPSTGTTTPAPAAGSLFFACMCNNNTFTVTDPSGWNAIANGFTSGMLTAARQTNNSPNQDLYTAYLLSDSAVSAQWTEVADDWGALAFSFAPPSAPVSLEQEGYRWRNDDGSETTATWKAAQDTNVSLTPDATTRLRFVVNAAGDPASKRFKLQYRKVGDASWRDLDTQG